MSASIVQIAAAVVSELNSGSFTQPFAAQRYYVPKFNLASAQELRVSVVPRSLTSKTLDRARDNFDYEIDVAIQQKVEPTISNLDALLELVEEIADYLRKQPLAAFPPARCIEVANAPLYAIEHLEEFRQFTSVLTLTYRLVR